MPDEGLTTSISLENERAEAVTPPLFYVFAANDQKKVPVIVSYNVGLGPVFGDIRTFTLGRTSWAESFNDPSAATLLRHGVTSDKYSTVTIILKSVTH